MIYSNQLHKERTDKEKQSIIKIKKTPILVFFIFMLLINFTIQKESPNDFEYALTNIVTKFKSEIMDKNECENLKYDTKRLIENIENALKKENEYTFEEITQLNLLKNETEALVEFIASVGNCGNYVPSIANFNIANRRVGAKVASLVKNRYCVDIISVSIGNYVAFLAENNSSNNYTVTYKYKGPNSSYSGNGIIGLSKQSVRHIYDNRDKPKNKYISVLGITCKAF
jgi:hypothetical protein